MAESGSEERGARLVLSRGIADHPGEVPDQELHLVAQLLEVAQLVDHHGVAEVQVGRRRIEAQLDTQLASGGELFHELFFDNQLVGAPADGLNGL